MGGGRRQGLGGGNVIIDRKRITLFSNPEDRQKIDVVRSAREAFSMKANVHFPK